MHMSLIIDIIRFLKFVMLGRSLLEVSHEVILSLSMMQWLNMDIAVDNFRRGILVGSFLSLWQILFVDGVLVVLMWAMIMPSLLVHCRGKVHGRRSHMRSMVNMIYSQEVSNWVQGGVLCGVLIDVGIHVMMFFMTHNGGCWR